MNESTTTTTTTTTATTTTTSLQWKEIPALGTRGTALHEACSQGTVAAIQQWLQDHHHDQNHHDDAPQAEEQDASSKTTTTTNAIIHPQQQTQACSRKRMHALTEDGQSCLWILARSSSVHTTTTSYAFDEWMACWKLLLRHGANPAISWHGQSLLQYLVALNHPAATEIVLYLLLFHQQSHPYDDDDKFQLFHTVADADAVSACNMGPLDIALRNANAVLIRALAAHGIPWTFSRRGLPIPIRFALAQGTVPWEVFLDAFQAFLDVVPNDVNVQGADGNGVVHLVALLAGKTYLRGRRDGAKQRAQQILHVMVAHQVNINAPAAGNGETALMLAAQADNVVFAQALLAAGADVHATDRQGRTAIFFAHDCVLLEALVVAHGANLEHVDAGGRTALLHAIASSSDNTSYTSCEQTVQALVQVGANLQARDDRGWSALHYGVTVGRDTIVSLLLRHGWSQSILLLRDDEGQSALHLLGCKQDVSPQDESAEQIINCRNGQSCLAKKRRFYGYTVHQYQQHVTILQTLLAHGADPMAVDKQGNLPFFKLAVTLARDEKDDDDLAWFRRCRACRLGGQLVVDKAGAQHPAFGLSLLLEMVTAAAGCGLVKNHHGTTMYNTTSQET